jgi:tetratricopeptide (TPR) repeat protein
MKKIFCLIFILLFSFASYSQQDNDKANKRMNKALEYFQEQKEDKAIECLNDIINDYPSYAPAYVALGEVFYSKKDFDKSISYYEKSISIDSSFDLNSFYRLALMQKEKKLYKQSKANFSYYAESEPSVSTAVSVGLLRVTSSFRLIPDLPLTEQEIREIKVNKNNCFFIFIIS